jgi:hypothetical protein
MKAPRWVLVVLCVIALPRSTAAGGSIMDIIAWLDELSGPGPFNGWVASVDVYCPSVTGSGPTRQSRCSPDGTRWSVAFEAGWWNDKPRPDVDGNVYLRVYQGVIYVPLRVITRSDRERLSTIAIGAGVGLYRFSGAATNNAPLWRVSLPLRVKLVPSELLGKRQWLRQHPRLRLLLSVPYFRAGLDVLPQSFDAADFSGLPPSYHPRRHFLKTSSLLTLDGRALALAILGRSSAAAPQPRP